MNGLNCTFVLGGALLILSAATARATDYTWNSASLQNWGTSGDWGGTVPGMPVTGSDTLTINTGSVEYDPSANGGDFRVDVPMTINAGALFQQTAGNGAWMKIGDSAGATVNDYGTFNGPTTGILWIGYNATVSNFSVLSGGILSTSAELHVQNGSQLLVSGTGSTATISSNVQYNGASTIKVASGGVMTVSTFTNMDTGTLWADGGSCTANEINTNSAATLKATNGGQITSNGQILLQNGSTLTVSGTGSHVGVVNMLFNNASSVKVSTGGSVTATGVTNVANGTLWVDGGTYNGADINLDSGGTFKITNGGTVSKSGNSSFGAGKTFTMSGATSSLTFTGTNDEFQPAGGTVTVDGGTINAGLIAFNGDECILEFSAGRINIGRGTFFDGIFSTGGTRYVNFTGDATGSIFLSGAAFGNAVNLLNDGKIRLNDVAGFNQFEVDSVSGGILIAVPEPASMSLLGVGGLLALRRRKSRSNA